MTDANLDQQHIEMLIYSKPSIPDRTDYILGKSNDNPVYAMIDVGNLLAAMGADFLAIPCVTAHYFNHQLRQEINIPIINILKETSEYLKSRGITRAGIMATEGTIYSGLFQDELKKYGIEAILPSKDSQKEITYLIYKNVKANQPVELEKFKAVSGELREKGAEVIILGCTELSLIKRDYEIGPGFIDVMEVLAMCSISLCEAKLKEEYSSLITK